MRQVKDFRQAKEIEELYNDVCSTCNHVKICTGRKNRQGPVWFCEEFDDYAAVMEPKSVGSEFEQGIRCRQTKRKWKESRIINKLKIYLLKKI